MISKINFPRTYFFPLVTCYIRYNMFQESTEKKNLLDIKRKCEITSQSAQIKNRESSEHCWR